MFGRVSSPRSAWTPRWRQHPEVLFFNPHLASNCSTCCIGMRFMLAFQHLCRAFQLLCTLWNTTASSQVAVHVTVVWHVEPLPVDFNHIRDTHTICCCLFKKEPCSHAERQPRHSRHDKLEHRFRRQIINKTYDFPAQIPWYFTQFVWDQLSKSSKSSKLCKLCSNMTHRIHGAGILMLT